MRLHDKEVGKNSFNEKKETAIQPEVTGGKRSQKKIFNTEGRNF